MIRVLLATTCLGIVLTSAARAEHHGDQAARIGSQIELGPRLGGKIEGLQGEQSQATTAKDGGQKQSAFRPAPARKVRVVYPALYGEAGGSSRSIPAPR